MLLAYENLSNQRPVKLELPVAKPESWRYRHVKLTGRFDNARQFLLDNQVSRGQVGYDVLTALRLPEDQGRVLVDRGWVPLGANREVLPDVAVSADKISIQGAVYVPYAQGYSLGGMATGETGWPLRVQFIDFKQMGARLKAPLAVMVIRLDPEAPYGYRREWEVVPFGPARHLGYAVQWFALACALLAIYIFVNLNRAR